MGSGDGLATGAVGVVEGVGWADVNGDGTGLGAAHALVGTGTGVAVPGRDKAWPGPGAPGSAARGEANSSK